MPVFRRNNFGRGLAYVLASLGSYTAIITAARGVLDKFGRGEALVSVIDSLPLFLNSPFAGVLATAVAFWILWRESRRDQDPNPSGVVDATGKAWRKPVHAVRAFGISVGTGLLLGVLTLSLFWFASHRIEFEVAVNKGGFALATVGQGASIVKIILTEIEPTMEAERFSINAVLECDGQPDVQMRHPEEGHAYDYPDQHGYRIKLFKATSEKAIFLVSKNP